MKAHPLFIPEGTDLVLRVKIKRPETGDEQNDDDQDAYEAQGELLYIADQARCADTLN